MQIRFDITEKTVTIDDEFTFNEIASQDKVALDDWENLPRFGPFRKDSEAFGFSLPNILGLWRMIHSNISIGQEELRHYYLNDAIIYLGHQLSIDNNVQHKQYARNSATKSANKGMQSGFENAYNQALNEIKDNKKLQAAIKLCYAYTAFPQIEDYVMRYFKQVHYIAPLRATAERYYRLRNLAVDEVDYQGKNLAIFINSLTNRQLKEFNDWTNVHFGFSVSTDKSKGQVSTRSTLRVKHLKVLSFFWSVVRMAATGHL